MAEQFYDSEMAAQQDRLASTPDTVEQRARIIRAISPEPGQALREAGTGNGALLRVIAPILEADGRILGLDNAPKMLEIDRGTAPGAEFVTGQAEALPFADGSFDAACAAQVLCFVPKVDRALCEMFRVLRPDGRVP